MARSMHRYFCKLCGAAFATHRTDQYFCCPEHQREYKTLRIKQGYRLIEYAIASRVRRGSKEQIARANAARRMLYFHLDLICGDERERLDKRLLKINEIRAAKSNLPIPIDPDSDETTGSPLDTPTSD